VCNLIGLETRHRFSPKLLYHVLHKTLYKQLRKNLRTTPGTESSPIHFFFSNTQLHPHIPPSIGNLEQRMNCQATP